MNGKTWIVALGAGVTLFLAGVGGIAKLASDSQRVARVESDARDHEGRLREVERQTQQVMDRLDSIGEKLDRIERKVGSHD